ncbi:MAG TPA: sigma-70 family RNA polymerase sigma factor [Solirubrobacterales bacterium]|nr:sigma-70 family RNA polymerase sigma factor [Solirubrobacterales bacterium]
MEAATAAPSLRARVQGARFARECERLRPLGEAYVLRRFGGSLSRADAEDVVAEVLIRLHRLAEEGRPPDNLRAAFFASVRNQAIDQLRARAVRPTVELEAAGEVPAGDQPPPEWAESRDDAARLQEALGRMRGNYREAILLRYGLGMTVPEIAEHCEISLPAAKKLILRATAQARSRMEAVEGSEVCPEIREQARRLVVEKEVSGVGEDGELELLRAHLAHCGPCKSFLASLHGHLHDLGSAAVLGYAGAEHFGRAGVLDGLGGWAASIVDGAQSGGGRIRTLAYKVGGAFNGSDGAPASALLSTGQKIAAVCTAGAATTATCLLTGAVGPGIVNSSSIDHPESPPAQVREVLPADEPSAAAAEAPAAGPVPESEPAPEPDRVEPAAAPAPSEPVSPSPEKAESASPPSEESRSEFGIEGSSAQAPEESSPAPPTSARSTGTQGSSGSTGSSSPSSGGEAEPAGAGVGFHG